MGDDKPNRIKVQTGQSLGLVWFIGWQIGRASCRERV